jgi:glutaminyl-peptide cyclotransferase
LTKCRATLFLASLALLFLPLCAQGGPWGPLLLAHGPVGPVPPPYRQGPAARPAAAPQKPGPDAAPKTHQVAIVQEIPKPEPLFTQGLFFDGGTLYESSGLYGRSRLDTFLIEEGVRLKGTGTLRFPPGFFAEGAALAGGRVLVLTWKEGTLFEVDPESLGIKGSIFYQGEGWGLTYDGERLLSTDGTDLIKVRDPVGFQEVAPPLRVKDRGRPVERLNELEWDPLGKVIYANIFQSDLVAAIDPASGSVLRYLDLSPLRRRALAQRKPGWPEPDVANGLALDGSGGLYATGKLWGSLYLIKPGTD